MKVNPMTNESMPQIGRRKLSAVLFTFLVVATLLSVPLLGGLNSGTVRADPGHNTDPFQSIQSSPNGTVFSGSNDNTVKALDAGTGDVVWNSTAHNQSVFSTAISPDETVVYTGSNDNTVKAMDADTGDQIWSSTLPDTVSSVSPSPSGDVVFAAVWDNTVRALDADTGEELWSASAHTDIANAVYSDPGGDVVYSGGYDNTVRALDAETGDEIWNSSAHTDYVYDVAASPDGSVVYSASYDNTVKALDAESGQVLWSSTAHSDYVFSVGPSPDGSVVYSGSEDNTVKALNASTGEEIWSSSAHSDSVYSAQESANGGTVYTGSLDSTVKAFNASTGNQIWSSSAHSSGVHSVAVPRVYSGSGAVSGTVQDQGGDPVDQATVSFTNTDTGDVTSAETGPSGNFGVSIENGTYDIEIAHEQYETYTATRTVQEGDDLGTFELVPTQIELSMASLMEPGSSQQYTVYFSSEGEKTNVTENATVTSSNASIAEVIQENNTIIGQSGVNTTVNITANYTAGNQTYNVTRELVVAEQTIGNLDIIPEAYWPTTILLDSTIQWIGMGLLMGLAFGRITGNPWATLGTAEFILSFGWMLGFVATGVMLASLFYVVTASIMIADVYRPRR